MSCNVPHADPTSPTNSVYVGDSKDVYSAETMMTAPTLSPQEDAPRQLEYPAQVEPIDGGNTSQQPSFGNHNDNNCGSPCYERDIAGDKTLQESAARWAKHMQSDSALADDSETSCTCYEGAPQLQAWIYETSNSEMTIGERLQKSHWEHDLEK